MEPLEQSCVRFRKSFKPAEFRTGKFCDCIAERSWSADRCIFEVFCQLAAIRFRTTGEPGAFCRTRIFCDYLWTGRFTGVAAARTGQAFLRGFSGGAKSDDSAWCCKNRRSAPGACAQSRRTGNGRKNGFAFRSGVSVEAAAGGDRCSQPTCPCACESGGTARFRCESRRLHFSGASQNRLSGSRTGCVDFWNAEESSWTQSPCRDATDGS